EANPAPWTLCSGIGSARLHRFEGLPFYAITVTGPRNDIAATLADLHEFFNRDARRAYDLIAFPDRSIGAGMAVRLMVVARSAEHSPTADQKIAGLEFMTGILVPGLCRLHPLSEIDRDAAFREVTLDTDQATILEQQLRNRFGTAAVKAVFGISKRP